MHRALCGFADDATRFGGWQRLFAAASDLAIFFGRRARRPLLDTLTCGSAVEKPPILRVPLGTCASSARSALYGVRWDAGDSLRGTAGRTLGRRAKGAASRRGVCHGA